MLKILIVDDSVFSQKSLAKFLNKYITDADITFAKDGLDGLEKYDQTKPDYVLVDLLMPKMDGRQFIKTLKEKEPAKIIVVSADVQKSIKEEVEQYNILSFINKPIDDDKAKYICDLIRDDLNG